MLRSGGEEVFQGCSADRSFAYRRAPDGHQSSRDFDCDRSPLHHQRTRARPHTIACWFPISGL